MANSSKDMPVMNDRYPGTNGKTQGERKDTTPATNAMMSVTSCILT